ncbi:MAG: cell division protein FtsA [Myxococcales bacterium]|nr:cell division protein FtsA [Myxococcales bacterium]
MSKQMIVAGLDIGTNAIKCVIGVHHDDGQIDIIGTGTHPAAGLKQGAVCDQPEAVRSIRAAVEEAELMAGCEIKEVFVSVSGRHFQSFNSHGMVRIQSGTVDDDDVAACIDMARAVRLPPDKTIMHAVPQEFIVDGKGGINRPHGVEGVRLEVHAHLVIGDTAALKALEACVRHARLRVVDVLQSPLAQAEALLTPQGRDIGVVLVDIGGDTTDVAVFERGQLVHSAMLAVGGWHVTQDIKGCLNTPSVEAEHLKQTHGCALAELVDADERVEVPGVGGRKRREIERTLLCQIIEARVEEILRMVLEELYQQGYGDGLPGGIVLTGGTANLPGIVELCEQVTGMPAARATPKGLHGLVDVVKNPRYATGTGLVLCGINRKHVQWFATRLERPRKRGIGRLFGRRAHA